MEERNHSGHIVLCSIKSLRVDKELGYHISFITSVLTPDDIVNTVVTG